MRACLSMGFVLGLGMPSIVFAGDLPCALDPVLTEVAATVALEGGVPTPEALRQLLQSTGSDLPNAFLRRFPPNDDAAVLAWLGDLARRSDAPLVCGEAVTAQRRIVVATARAGSLEVVGEAVRGRIEAGYRDPRLVVQAADGELVNLSAEGLERAVPIPEDLDRPVRVQLVASGPSGPRPVAQCVLGQPGGLPPVVHVDTDGWDQIQALRRAHGGLRLRWNRLMGEQAQEHAATVCRTRRVGHVDAGQDPEERLRQAGIEARVVGEAVARGHSLQAAFDAFADSPSHLAAITDRRFTDGGVAAATDSEQNICVVVLLAAWPRFVGR